MTALINDTTGTLIASHYVNPSRFASAHYRIHILPLSDCILSKIAVIFGTGCNAAYMERIGNIEKIKVGISPPSSCAHRSSVSIASSTDIPYAIPFWGAFGAGLADTASQDLGLPADAQMAINCEWGAFDSFVHEHLPRTK